ncbi:MAG: hypothetical protein ACK40G_13760 [Cytophagaceae bacterium]
MEKQAIQISIPYNDFLAIHAGLKKSYLQPYDSELEKLINEAPESIEFYTENEGNRYFLIATVREMVAQKLDSFSKEMYLVIFLGKVLKKGIVGTNIVINNLQDNDYLILVEAVTRFLEKIDSKISGISDEDLSKNYEELKSNLNQIQPDKGIHQACIPPLIQELSSMVTELHMKATQCSRIAARLKALVSNPFKTIG